LADNVSGAHTSNILSCDSEGVSRSIIKTCDAERPGAEFGLLVTREGIADSLLDLITDIVVSIATDNVASDL
jgi:hypothetical protein